MNNLNPRFNTKYNSPQLRTPEGHLPISTMGLNVFKTRVQDAVLSSILTPPSDSLFAQIRTEPSSPLLADIEITFVSSSPAFRKPIPLDLDQKTNKSKRICTAIDFSSSDHLTDSSSSSSSSQTSSLPKPIYRRYLNIGNTIREDNLSTASIGVRTLILDTRKQCLDLTSYEKEIFKGNYKFIQTLSKNLHSFFEDEEKYLSPISQLPVDYGHEIISQLELFSSLDTQRHERQSIISAARRILFFSISKLHGQKKLERLEIFASRLEQIQKMVYNILEQKNHLHHLDKINYAFNREKALLNVTSEIGKLKGNVAINYERGHISFLPSFKFQLETETDFDALKTIPSLLEKDYEIQGKRMPSYVFFNATDLIPKDLEEINCELDKKLEKELFTNFTRVLKGDLSARQLVVMTILQAEALIDSLDPPKQNIYAQGLKAGFTNYKLEDLKNNLLTR